VRALSPAYDPDWETRGLLHAVLGDAAAYLDGLAIPGLTHEILTEPGRTPLLYVDVPGRGAAADETVLFYGHLDKQPEFTGWNEGTGPWTPVFDGIRLFGRGSADDAYAVCLLGPRFELQPSWGPLVEASAALTLLAFDLGALALLVGAVTGSRGTALGVASATAAAAYLVSALAPAVPALRGVRWISPFTWAVGDNQLVHGLSVPELGALIAVGLVMVALCLPAMRRLDIH